MIKIILLVLGLVASIFVLFSSWIVHIVMCKEENCPYGWGNFNKFLEQFNKHDKWYVTSWENSFFSKDYSKYYIHADIIKFDGKCMILGPISYLRFRTWSKKKWKEMKNIYRVQW